MNVRQKRKLVAGTGLISILLGAFMVVAPLGAGAAAGGGNEDCPAGSVQIAKFNYQGGGYSEEGGPGPVEIDDDATAQSGEWTSTTPIEFVVVKGGTDAKVVDVNGATSGTFDGTGLENGGGNQPGISNVKFCGPDSTDECPELDGEQGPEDDCTPDECPELDGEQGPEDDCTPDECPELDGEQGPEDDCTPDECPELDGEQGPEDDCTPDECPELDGEQGPEDDCTPPPFDACPNTPGNQPRGTDCTPPPFDACPSTPGNQPRGTDCTPPPFDACPNTPGNQPQGTDCTPPVVDACPDQPGNQAEGSDCTPPPVDVCPDDPGVQADEEQCTEVLPDEQTPQPNVQPTPNVQPNPVATSKPVAKPVNEVRGSQTVRALPRTGDETHDLARVGALMLAAGAAMVLGSKRKLARR